MGVQWQIFEALVQVRLVGFAFVLGGVRSQEGLFLDLPPLV